MWIREKEAYKQTERQIDRQIDKDRDRERSEVLRSLRHYLRAQSQGHHTIDRRREE